MAERVDMHFKVLAEAWLRLIMVRVPYGDLYDEKFIVPEVAGVLLAHGRVLPTGPSVRVGRSFYWVPAAPESRLTASVLLVESPDYYTQVEDLSRMGVDDNGYSVIPEALLTLRAVVGDEISRALTIALGNHALVGVRVFLKFRDDGRGFQIRGEIDLLRDAWGSAPRDASPLYAPAEAPPFALSRAPVIEARFDARLMLKSACESYCIINEVADTSGEINFSDGSLEWPSMKEQRKAEQEFKAPRGGRV